jgi:hypothetical protein
MMAHYAFLDENNVVTEVITGINENITQYGNDKVVGGSTEAWEEYYGNLRGQTCKRTSYNAKHGQVYDLATDSFIDGTSFRKNFAQPGYTYREDLDAFIKPQPYPSWTLDEERGRWLPPLEHPDNMQPTKWIWNEETQGWDLNPAEQE